MDDVKIRNILKEGDIIRTRHNEAQTWVTNVVLGIDEECIEIDIGLEKEYIKNMVMVGDAMKCKYTTNEKEYNLVGWVTRIKPDFPQKLTIRIHDINWFDNKRDSYRHDVYLCAIIKNTESELKGSFAVVTNLSMSGVAITSQDDINVAEELPDGEKKLSEKYLELFIENNTNLVFKGYILRKIKVGKKFEYGIRISIIDEENEKKLRKFIEELENQDKEFYNKKSSFWSKNSKFSKEG